LFSLPANRLHHHDTVFRFCPFSRHRNARRSMVELRGFCVNRQQHHPLAWLSGLPTSDTTSASLIGSTRSPTATRDESS